MTARRHHRIQGSLLLPLVLLTTAWLALAFATNVRAVTITNLQQLTQALSAEERITCDVDIEVTVCSMSRPETGVLIVQDKTGTELLELDSFDPAIQPGERIRIQHNSCLLRRREMGIEVSPAPIVDVDGLHARKMGTATVRLPAGKIPLQLEWFNSLSFFNLEVQWSISNRPLQTIADAALWHSDVTELGTTNFLPGLRAECFEGFWDCLPDFNLLQPVKSGVVTNFDTSFRTRYDLVGIRFTGYLEIPSAGQYRFNFWSDDGGMLFLGDQHMSTVRLGHTNPPIASPIAPLACSFTNLDERHWVEVEGRVRFVSRIGKGVRFDIGTDGQVISVRLADAAGLDLSTLLNSRVKVAGVGRGVMISSEATALGKLFAANAKDLTIVEPALYQGDSSQPITSIAQVQSLPIDKARQGLPVHLHGTVTGAKYTTQEHWMSFEDDTRGIFVKLPILTNKVPAFGEMWEVEGHSAVGDFAPIVIAEKLTRLGGGQLPSPVRPTWTELLNGSKDVQWAELKGLVAGVHSNTISLSLPEGRLDVAMENSFEPEFRQYLKAVVKIRGVLYAVWDSTTHEVRVGRVMMRYSAISVEVPAPADPFDAVVKTPRELLLFDAQASAFRPVKVRGQIVYADPTQLILEELGSGLRLLPMEKSTARPGDLVEAVGYPDIGRSQLMLRDVLLRKTGDAPLPIPKTVDGSSLSEGGLNSARVRIEGKLLGWHAETGTPVLEMQFGSRVFLARIANAEPGPLSLRPDSRLALVGVYVGDGHSKDPRADSESFELLLNDMSDITVLSQPSWWTLPRLLALVSVLMVILLFTIVWNSQLRRLVEQRTNQLKREVHERERIERQHALEAERSRIARDLHDDLGSSLTEISVLASTGQLPQTSPDGKPTLFQTIGEKARSLISALDVIVWAVDPEDNSLQSLADYLSGYTDEFFTHTPIACRFKVPVSFPSITLEGRIRHDLLMAVKEALNNIVRHAEATEVEFRMGITDNILEIVIADNGTGIKNARHSGGHGLKNLSARLQNLGGACRVETRPGGGTTVSIQLPLGAASEVGSEQAAAE